MRISIALICLALNASVGAQEVLSPLSFNPLLTKPAQKLELKPRGSQDSVNYTITYEEIDLPFVDEFSTNKQRPANKNLPSPINQYYVVGKCTSLLNYKMGNYKFSKLPSTEDTYNPAFPPDFITTTPLSPILFSLNDSPDCNTLVLENIYPPTIKRKFTATGTLLSDSLIYDTLIYSAQIKDYFLKGYLWTDRHAYFNSHLPFMPPSKGVATLDGLNEYGEPYNKLATNAYGLADYLTSAPLLMASYNGSDSAYLSFLYQPQGLGDNPNVEDSLLVEFLDDRGRWFPVWTVKGTKNDEQSLDSIGFRFASIHIPDPIVASDPNYFHNKFQFRFKNYATISGNNDHWHIDYVRLDTGRTFFDTSLRDASFVYELPSMLKRFTLLPTQQYRGGIDVEDTIFGINRNIYPAPIFNAYKYNCINENTGLIFANNTTGKTFSADPLVYHPLESNADLNFPVFIEDSTYVTTKIYLDQSDGFVTNDTATTRQFFFNEMAYDDGTAEWAYGLQGLGTKKVAYRFFIPNKDTLAAVKILFTSINGPVSSLLFNLTIWKTIGMNGSQEQVLRTMTNLKPKYIDSLNSFVTFALDEPLEVQDTIYVGWIQSDERNLQIGYDRNSKKGFENIFVELNNIWSKSNIAPSRLGSPMMRLILDGQRKFSTAGVKPQQAVAEKKNLMLYPNPADLSLTLQLETRSKSMEIIVYDLMGKLVLEKSLHETNTLDVSSLNPGMYILRLVNDGEILQTEKLQISR